MKLKGSCHCQAVKFEVQSPHPYPYQRCFCSICRKTQGGGGFAINLSADNTTMKITGEKNISIYHARMKNPEDKKAHRSSGERHFCKECGSALWVYDAEYPELIHPFASAIDTPLPKAPEHTDLMLEFKPDWVEIPKNQNKNRRDKKFQRYPKESIAQWHDRLGLTKQAH